MSDNYKLILSAIETKQQVTAIYKGYYREMCPHVIGEKKGKNHALFYQFAGESSSGSIKPNDKSNWRCIQIDELTEVKLRKGEWHTNDNHSQKQTCVDDIELEVDC